MKSNFFNTKYEKKEGLGFGVHSYNWVPHKSGSFPGGLCLMQRIDWRLPGVAVETWLLSQRVWDEAHSSACSSGFQAMFVSPALGYNTLSLVPSSGVLSHIIFIFLLIHSSEFWGHRLVTLGLHLGTCSLSNPSPPPPPWTIISCVRNLLSK